MHVRTGEAVSRAVQGKCTTRVETSAVHAVSGCIFDTSEALLQPSFGPAPGCISPNGPSSPSEPVFETPAFQRSFFSSRQPLLEQQFLSVHVWPLSLWSVFRQSFRAFPHGCITFFLNSILAASSRGCQPTHAVFLFNVTSSFFTFLYYGIHWIVFPRTAHIDLIVNACDT